MTTRAQGKEAFENVEVENVFISAGCNRSANVAAWGPTDLVAFGAHNAVAIFCPQDAKIVQTLPGHIGFVSCVEWLPKYQSHNEDAPVGEEQYLLSGSADGVIILWAACPSTQKFILNWRKVMDVPKAHKKTVSCIAGLMLSSCEALFVSCSSDCTVHVWSASFPIKAEGECNVTFLQSISTSPRAVMAVSLALLPATKSDIILAMGGLDNHIHLYCKMANEQFMPRCILKGHQDWIRSLDFSQPLCEGVSEAIFLASGGQDKTIKIWRISQKSSHTNIDLRMYIEGPVFKAGSLLWQASLESLLVGHDDWVYSVRWQPPSKNIQAVSKLQHMSILSASMDRTMMIWRPDANTGVWMNEVNVGELGHTALGFYGGLWSPCGGAILAYAYGGSFHMWRNVGNKTGDWQPHLVPSGHSDSVVDVAWGRTNQFLLSASHDQTARLFAPWDQSLVEKTRKVASWHEIARPQVHGHALNCLSILRNIGNHQYVSGSEEKVARVFEAPAMFLQTVECIEGYKTTSQSMIRPEDVKILGANMSALGLSQKPIYSKGGQSDKALHDGMESMEAVPEALPAVLSEPPLEEHLSCNTLWPESHKLYGHGNELFSMCCDHRGLFLATSCKAQSASVAEIWLWQLGSWRVAGCLHSHNLTVTQMEFSHDDKYLLSVSRDRKFSLFQATKSRENTSDEQPPYKLVSSLEAHKRIIWACSWSPCSQYFATGSRDKSAKIWSVEEHGGISMVKQVSSLPLFQSSVTSLSWAPSTCSGEYLLVTGTEEGLLALWKIKPMPTTTTIDVSSFHGCRSTCEITCLFHFDKFMCHSASVNHLAWKEKCDNRHEKQEVDVPSLENLQLASCGADHTVRLFSVNIH